MAEENELVTVFRSADPDAESQAVVVRDMLAEANLDAEVFDDSAPGVPEGACEVRVPAAQADHAERLVNARQEPTPRAVDLSHDLDMVSVFSFESADAEMAAFAVRGILDAQGIPSVLVGSSVLPNLPFEIRVPKSRLEDARKAIAAAEEAGPAAAEEAEIESEGSGGN